MSTTKNTATNKLWSSQHRQ